MGFFLRKSVRLGPVRFNFAKSGIGASVGVRGLRVGQNALGRGYIFGRVVPGLYYRQALGTGEKSGGAGCALAALAAVGLLILAAVFLR